VKRGASLGLSSVETLIIPSTKAANDPELIKVLARANAVFIAGGDQSDYIKFWKGTRLEHKLKEMMKNNVPIGGTSAGLAVMGQFDYSALHASITSSEAMSNPYDKNITFDPNPLSLTGGFIAPPELAYMIFDSHFDSRDRMGRLITFISRTVAPDKQFGCSGGILKAGTGSTSSARGIGIGVETALLVQGNGANLPVTARRVTNISTTSESAVYFVRPSVAPSLCANKKPLTIHTVEVKKLADSNTVFNLSEWAGVSIYKYLDVNTGALSPANWY
jgi:cyanophycinase-like exopeptidase